MSDPRDAFIGKSNFLSDLQCDPGQWGGLQVVAKDPHKPDNVIVVFDIDNNGSWSGRTKSLSYKWLHKQPR